MSAERMMKVARCKTCGKAFHYSIWPTEHPSEDLTMGERLSDYRHMVDSSLAFDRSMVEGHAVTVEPLTNETLACRCYIPLNE